MRKEATVELLWDVFKELPSTYPQSNMSTSYPFPHEESIELITRSIVIILIL
jgi:hypothetical protein